MQLALKSRDVFAYMLQIRICIIPCTWLMIVSFICDSKIYLSSILDQMGHYLECADNMSTVLTVKLQWATKCYTLALSSFNFLKKKGSKFHIMWHSSNLFTI